MRRVDPYSICSAWVDPSHRPAFAGERRAVQFKFQICDFCAFSCPIEALQMATDLFQTAVPERRTGHESPTHVRGQSHSVTVEP
jgi:formate hydrogenlyase subunit 6/NADH:ubiquinone oxidoreductase subunit I